MDDVLMHDSPAPANNAGHFAAGVALTHPPVYWWTWAIITLDTAAFFSLRTDFLWSVLMTLLFAVVYMLFVKFGRAYAADPEKNGMAGKISDGIAVLGMLCFLPNILMQQWVTGLLLLLLCMQAALLCKLKSTRELYFLFAASFIMLLFCVANTKSGFFIVLVMAYFLVAMGFLQAVFTQTVKQKSAIAVVSPLQKNTFHGAAILVSCAIILLATVLYLSLPRPIPLHAGSFISDGGQQYHQDSWYDEATTGAKSKDQDSNQGAGTSGDPDPDQYAGFGQKFSIEKKSQATGIIGNPIVLYLQADRELYLRGNVFDFFDGVSWSMTDNSNKKIQLKNGFHSFEPYHQKALVHQMIEAAQPMGNRIFGSPRIIDVHFPGSVFAIDHHGNLLAPRDIVAGTRYEVDSQVDYYNGRFVAQDTAAADPALFLQTPADMSERVHDLAASVTRTAPDQFRAAILLEDYLRSHYRYNLDSIFNSQGVTPVEKFLFEKPEGHCEYFASAMVMLLRTLDIPARFVTGYTSGSYNPITGYHEIRALNGHAWVEGWIAGVGWVTFEPTPAFSIPQQQEKQMESTAQELDTYAQQTSDALREAPVDVASSMKIILAEAFVFIRHAIEHGLHILWHALVVAITVFYPLLFVCGVLVAVGYVFRIRILDAIALVRIKLLHRQSPEVQVLQLWRELEKWMARQGYRRKPSETVYEYQERLDRIMPGIAEPVGILAKNFSALIYGDVKPNQQVVAGCYDAFTVVTARSTSRNA
ncbi:MAG TPA: transglutaminaseTgpA domain-containing protein [Pseudomonadales bacterium]|nr:transglutaminaseTgpA domain-containing protein [Pseudomonadales bacterium]